MKQIKIIYAKEFKKKNKIKLLLIRYFWPFFSLLLFIILVTILTNSIIAKGKLHDIKEENNVYKNKKHLDFKEIRNKYSSSYNLVNNKYFNNYNNKIKENLKNKINKTYMKYGKVNINKIEETISGGRKYQRKKNRSNEINIGFQLDPEYILRTMITVASIMDSQNKNTGIRLHFIVVLGFNVENMLKIYSIFFPNLWFGIFIFSLMIK